MAIQASAPFRRSSALPAESIFESFLAVNAVRSSAVGPAVHGLDFVCASRTAGIVR